jgi:hypothetical protein
MMIKSGFEVSGLYTSLGNWDHCAAGKQGRVDDKDSGIDGDPTPFATDV